MPPCSRFLCLHQGMGSLSHAPLHPPRLRELCVKLMFLHPVDYGRKAEELLWRKVYYEVIQLIKTNKKVREILGLGRNLSKEEKLRKGETARNVGQSMVEGGRPKEEVSRTGRALGRIRIGKAGA